MALALVTGSAPPLLSDIDGLSPYFHPPDCVAYGTRDHLYSDDFIETPYSAALHRLDVNAVHDGGENAAVEAVARVTQDGSAGFWIHFDVDVLEDSIMPAVDYRMQNGLSWDELALILGSALATGKALGMTLTIYNPNLDPS